MYHNYFQQGGGRSSGEDVRINLIRKVFPAVQFGRDIDLEQYILLRKSGRPNSVWRGYYDNLSHRYTPEERRALIHVGRKFGGDFDHIFSLVIDRLYSRIVSYFKKKIDLIILALEPLEGRNFSGMKDRNFFLEHIKKGVDLCSSSHARAYNDIQVMEFFSRNLGYRDDRFLEAAEWIKRYLNGMLFAERQGYHFDINEERRKLTGEQGGPARLNFFISPEDISRMVLEEDMGDEYEQAFAYFEHYFARVKDVSFANKLFIYSRTNQTYHYKIFDVVRRGIANRLTKERIFDDIFKILCNGRYIYNIAKERQIQKRILFFIRTQTKKEESRKRRTLAIREKKAKIIEGIVKTPPRVEAVPEKRPLPIEPPPQPPKPVPAISRKEDKAGAFKTIDQQIMGLTEDKAEQRFLKEEFKTRLSIVILNHYKSTSDLEQEMPRIKEFIKLALSRYDSILVEPEWEEDLRKYDFNRNLFYSLVFRCFVDLKSDYLMNNLSKKSPFRFLSLFRRSRRLSSREK